MNLSFTKKNHKIITLIPLNNTNSKDILETKHFSKTLKTITCKQDSKPNIYNEAHKVLKNPKINANSNDNSYKSIKSDNIRNKNYIIPADKPITLIKDINNTENCIPNIIKYFHPKYPNTAKLLGIEGEISVMYNINIMGKIEKIKILPNVSSGIFEESIRLAMRQWIYEKDQPQQNLIVVFKFSLNKIQVTTN